MLSPDRARNSHEFELLLDGGTELRYEAADATGSPSAAKLARVAAGLAGGHRLRQMSADRDGDGPLYSAGLSTAAVRSCRSRAADRGGR